MFEGTDVHGLKSVKPAVPVVFLSLSGFDALPLKTTECLRPLDTRPHTGNWSL